MANGSILSLSREIVHCMKDKNGNYRVEPIGMVRHRNLDEYHLGVLKSYIELLGNGSYINEETREYIFNNKFTIKNVAESLSAKNEKPLNFKTAASKINYGKQKLDSDFGIESIYKMLSNRSKDLSEEIIAISKHSGASKNEIKELLIDGVWSNEIKIEADNERFETFIKGMKAYTKKGMREFIKEYKDELAYLNFLNTNTILSEEDIRKKSEFVRILG